MIIYNEAKPLRFAMHAFEPAPYDGLLLAEPGDSPLHSCMEPLQSKLSRALQCGEIQPICQDQVETVNVRVIAATNCDLTTEGANRDFPLTPPAMLRLTLAQFVLIDSPTKIIRKYC